MKFPIVLAVLATYMTKHAAANLAKPFSIYAYRPDTPIHMERLSGAEGSLWIKHETSSFCPKDKEEKGLCPRGVRTNFLGGQIYLGMAEKDTTGQQVHIARKTGRVMYSAQADAGTLFRGWSIAHGTNIGLLTYQAGLLACPLNYTDPDGPWKVFVNLHGATFTDECLSFDALTFEDRWPAAWSYNEG